MSTRRSHGTQLAARPHRAAVADSTTGTDRPTLEFAASTPYDDYVGTRTLHALLRTRTEHPAETAFLAISQVMELYFGLLRAEWERAQRDLRADRLDAAVSGLWRTRHHLDALNASWGSLEWLTPAEFNGFREALGEASGFQSYGYRHVEFLLGLKEAARIRPHKAVPDVYADLERALHAPSVYDDAIAFLARRGLPIAADAYERDFAAEYVPREDVERAWVSVYSDPRPGNELFLLGEALTEIANGFTTWRHRHLMAVKRAMGAKAGTGGSTGLQWLERSLARDVFPELWSARTAL